MMLPPCARPSPTTGPPKSAILAWQTLEKPIDTVDFLGVRARTLPVARLGLVRRCAGWANRSDSAWRLYGQAPAVTTELPAAWWVPASLPEVIERLKLHGIRFETIEAPSTRTLDMVPVWSISEAGPAKRRPCSR